MKFTEDGHVLLSVRLEDDLLHFSIEDTGIGIAEEKLVSLFDPFTQADVTTTRKFGGTGLGLAISRQLVLLMGGEVKVESEEGKGSCFFFTVKLPTVAFAAPLAFRDTHLSGKRLLLVDDSAPSRLALSELMSDWGIQIDTAADGVEGLVKMSTTPGGYDLVILDHHMPGLSGVDISRAMAVNPGLQNVPRLLLIRMGESLGEAGRGLSAIARPARPDTLRTAILRATNATPEPVTTSRLAAAAETTTSKPAKEPDETRILVAEDNAVNQLLARRLMRKMGYEYEIVSNGRLAVERWKEGGISMILMDCMMPELDGYGATREIRRLENGQGRTPILAMTANALSGAREKCLESGMDDYLTKPIDAASLQDTIVCWLAKSQQSEPVPVPVPEPVPVPIKVLDDKAIARLESIGEEDLSELNELIELFISDAQERIAAINHDPENHHRVYRTVHALKSACGYLGARELKNLCAEVERNASQDIGSLEQIRRMPAALERFQIALPLRIKMIA